MDDIMELIFLLTLIRKVSSPFTLPTIKKTHAPSGPHRSRKVSHKPTMTQAFNISTSSLTLVIIIDIIYKLEQSNTWEEDYVFPNEIDYFYQKK